jgi:hypothetical protein
MSFGAWEVSGSSRNDIFLGGDDGRGYINMYKRPGVGLRSEPLTWMGAFLQHGALSHVMAVAV